MKLSFDKSFLEHAPDNKYLVALLPKLQQKKIQVFTTLTLTLITFSVFSLFAISPTLGTITDLKKQISDNQFVNDQMTKKITALSLLQDNYTRLKPQLPALYNAVPTDANLAMFLGQLQAIADISNVSVNRVQTLPVDFSATDNTTYTTFAFAIDVQGTKETTVQFLKNVTSFSRVISLESLTFGKATRLANIYQLSLRGRAYFQKQ